MEEESRQENVAGQRRLCIIVYTVYQDRIVCIVLNIPAHIPAAAQWPPTDHEAGKEGVVKLNFLALGPKYTLTDTQALLSRAYRLRSTSTRRIARKIVQMGSVCFPPRHQQVCWSAVLDQKQPVSALDATDEDKRRDEMAFQKVDQSTPQPGLHPNEQDISVYPMLSDKDFLRQLREFHQALTKAIVNIVERWWDDSIAGFPSRMPLEPRVEEVLKDTKVKTQWIDEQSKNKSVPAFADCLGNWRPDFLLTHNDTSAPGLGFQVCEINSRTPYNAIIHTAYKHGIMKELVGSDAIIEPAGDFETMVHGMFDHFNLDLPIHLVRGRDSLERQEFALLAELKTGSQPRLVDVSDLQLKPDDLSSTGLALYCKLPGTGDKVEPERVHQVALALFPEEYNLLSPGMLRHLAKISVNDLRTGLFVNDQRFLGIILQELNDLVERHQVLTPGEAHILQEGIVPTILPGSPELKRILSKSKQEGTLKNNFMLKAARASRGHGHRLGDELSAEEWEAALLGMQDPTIRTDTTSYVLQPYVRQPKFDIVADKNRTVPNCQVVGTYYTVDGRFVGLGPWRAGNGKICNVHGGGCVLITSVTPPSQDFIIPTVNDSSVPSRPLQVCLSASQKKGMPVSALDASYEDRKRAEEAYYPVIFQYIGSPSHLPYELRYMNPHPLLISDQFLVDLRLFHEALAIALNSIVQRWFTDKEAAFPTRMPLEPHEEDLLLWLSNHCETYPKHAYEGHQGTWRPDLLIPADEQDGFQMCEINARFFSLSIDLGSWIHRALGSEEAKPSFLDIPANNDCMIEAYFKMFNPNLPIYLLQSENFLAAPGRSSIMGAFIDWVEKRTGMRPRSVTPDDLRLVPDATSETGYALYCTQPASESASSGLQEEETLERIHQVGLQIEIGEYAALHPEIHRLLALSGANDARSRLIVHDKRILGILHQELDDLVRKHHVLTEAQAALLRTRIVPTIIPGSQESNQLLNSYHQGKISKDDFIIKPVRGARGQGIKFGDELEPSEWEQVLGDMQNPGLSADQTTYVIQWVVKQAEEDLFLDEELGAQRCQRVGTYYAVDGEFVGLGAWRAIMASKRVCNMSLGGAWKMGSMLVSHE